MHRFALPPLSNPVPSKRVADLYAAFAHRVFALAVLRIAIASPLHANALLVFSAPCHFVSDPCSSKADRFTSLPQPCISAQIIAVA